MSINSRQKGKRIELEFCHLLRDHGLHARRGQQYAGGTDSPDVVSESLPDFHFEVKGVQNLNLTKAMEQSITDAGDLIPVVAHKKNHGKWMVTMLADDWINLVKESEFCV